MKIQKHIIQFKHPLTKEEITGTFETNEAISECILIEKIREFALSEGACGSYVLENALYGVKTILR